MNQEELETYEYQLSQIKLGLAKDPNNAELQTLKSELEDLISLTKQYLGANAAPAAAAASSSHSSAAATRAPSASASASPAPSAAKPKPAPAARTAAAPGTSAAAAHKFASGDDCSCRYSDGKWYPARITSISGPADQPVYTVVFRGYDTPEVVPASDLRPLNKWDAKEAKEREAAVAGEKRKALGATELSKDEMEKERKRRKNEKKAETQKAKAEEASSKAKSWQAFAKKGTKKGVHIPGVAGGSMFRSPDDMMPNAKVGVVGGGRGVTANQQRKRQTFQDGGDE
ncbi:hypothetical protein JCM10449v2_005376 [Rhodotorula kratochvilovae]